jgi:hypothetical protein
LASRRGLALALLGSIGASSDNTIYGSQTESTYLEGRILFGLFGKQRKSLPGLARDLKDLTITYAKQETIDPLKSLGGFLLWGTLGSFAIGIGLVLVALGGLRALQEETGDHLTGHLTWVPYVVVLIGCLIVATLSVWAIFSEKRRAGKRRRQREERKASEATA